MAGGKKVQIIRVEMDTSAAERNAQLFAEAQAKRAQERAQQEATSAKAVADTARKEAREREQADTAAFRKWKEEMDQRHSLAMLEFKAETDAANKGARERQQADTAAFRKWKEEMDQKHSLAMQEFKVETDTARKEAREKQEAETGAFRKWKEEMDQKHSLAMQEFKAETDAAKKGARDKQEADTAAFRKWKEEMDQKHSLAMQEFKADTDAAKKGARDKQEADTAAFRKWKEEMDQKHAVAMLGFKYERDSQAERQRGWRASNDAIMGGVRSVGMFTAAMIGVSSAGQVLTAVLERFELLRTRALEESGKMTAEATDMRKLSTLENHLGAPSLTQASQLRLRAQTMQTASESEAMTTAAKASGFGAIASGRVSAEDFDKFLVSQGRLQTLTGADASAVGNAAGLMPMISGKDTNSAKDLENLSGRLFEINRLGGFSDYGQSAKQLGESSGYVMKGIYSAPETQALLSAFAYGGEANTASERLTQLTRATSSSMMRTRMPKLGDDYKVDAKNSYEYFKGLGVNDQTAPIERAMAVVRDVQAQEDAAKKARKKFYGTDYLQKRGFNSVQDREAILKLVGVSRTGMLDQLMDKARAPIGDATEMQGAWKGMMADPVFQKRASDIQTEAENKGFGTGAGGVKTFENQMLERAYAETGGAGGNAGYDLDAIKNRWRVDPRNWGNMQGSLSNLEWESQHMVLGAAKRAGVKTPFVDRIDAKTGEKTGENWLGWETLQKLDQETRKAGGVGALGANTEKLERAMDRLATAMEKYIDAPGAPKPAAGGAGVPLAAPMPKLVPVRQ